MCIRMKRGILAEVESVDVRPPEGTGNPDLRLVTIRSRTAYWLASRGSETFAWFQVRTDRGWLYAHAPYFEPTGDPPGVGRVEAVWTMRSNMLWRAADPCVTSNDYERLDCVAQGVPVTWEDEP